MIMDYHGMITIESGKGSGKPCIPGIFWIADGMTTDKIFADFSKLPYADIKTCFTLAINRDKKWFLSPP
jgi:uncharacterized protein (DUF433 family)